MMVELDLFPLFIEAVANNKVIRGDLEELYNQKKTIFKQSALESGYYNHPFITYGNVSQEIYGRKSLGLLVYLIHNPGDASIKESILKIINKGWPNAYNFVVQHKEANKENKKEISLDDYMNQFKKSKISITIIDIEELVVVAWLVHYMSIPMAMTEEWQKLLLVLNNKINMCGRTEVIDLYNNMSASAKIKVDELKEQIHNYYKLNLGEGNQITVQQSELLKDLTYYNMIEYTEEIFMHAIPRDLDLTTDDMNNALGAYLNVFEDANVERAARLLIPSLAIKLLLKEYNSLKKKYKAIYDESKIEDLQTIASLQAEVITYKESMDQLLDTLNGQKREIETRRQENEELQKEIAKLKAQQNKTTPENPAG